MHLNQLQGTELTASPATALPVPPASLHTAGASQGRDQQAPRRRILFTKLGSFSYFNDKLHEQLSVHFPDHDIEVFDVKEYVKQRYGVAALNLLIEMMTYGPSVLTDRAQLHAFFFKTPFIFRLLSAAITRIFAPRAREFDFSIQTQGIFSGRIPGRPHLIYTDYTFMDNLIEPEPDRRLFRSKTYLRCESALFRQADGIATTGSFVERTLVEHYGCDQSRVRTVHIGANVDIVPSKTTVGRYATNHILFVGVEWKRKGGPALVEAFIEVARKFPDARLTIVGCSPDVSHPQIAVVGQVPRDLVAPYFEAASVFCLPSIIEPLGIAVIEASLFRLPVIATQIRGFLETVTDGETGILIPPNDTAALAAAMRHLFLNPSLGQQMGLAGFERNRTRFDWNQVGKQLHEMACGVVPGLTAAAGAPPLPSVRFTP
ncbi:MAG TPA: hypothetical protein DDZ81_17860 [Acetobacteraceae bacterium]|jgi:glycosyltransferase involved in cell wall biosynthesis|nr:hypothetical protein [Acetobacteraceae bacterium]